MMRDRQQGLGWFGSLIVLALTAGAGYYLYQLFVVGEEAPSCAALHQDCLTDCRRSATDNESMQACRKTCENEAQTCAAFGRAGAAR
jgi:hypothetical protein